MAQDQSKHDDVPGAPPLSKELERTVTASEQAAAAAAARTAPEAAEPAEPFDDDATNEAVDDIVVREGDELLAAHDTANQPSAAAAGAGSWRRLLRRKTTWYTLVILLCAGAGTAAAVEPSRHYALNTAGVRASLALTVVDDKTRQPLKNVQVQAGGKTATTDVSGKARVDGLRLGPTTVHITGAGFTGYERRLTVGWGSNPQGDIRLRGVGMPYTFVVTDAITGKGLQGAEVASGQAAAIADKTGKAVLIVPGSDDGPLAATVNHNGYRAETVHATGAETTTAVGLVTARKALFVTKQSGTYDVYKSDIDGQHKQVLLAGTGSETANISLAVSPDGSRAALVSTRADRRDDDGRLLATLTLITVADGSNVAIGSAAHIRLVDWVGTRLVFEQTAAGPAVAPSNKTALISYDYAANTRLQLATASRFAGVSAMNGTVYYAAAADETLPQQTGVFKIGADGAGRQTLLDAAVWTVYRAAYNTLHVQTPEGWTALNATSGGRSPLTAPGTYLNRLYIEHPAASGHSLRVDLRDGQGVLLRHERQGDSEHEIYRQPGLTQPVRWLTDDIVIFRVAADGEIADYVVSSTGGPAHKIADVTATYGFLAGQ